MNLIRNQIKGEENAKLIITELNKLSITKDKELNLYKVCGKL